MKNKYVNNYLWRAVIGAAIMTGCANAALVTYNPGDLLMGFYDTTGSVTKSVVVDIGNVTQFATLTSGSTLNTGNLNTDLVATFGSSWYTSGNVVWGIAVSPSNTSTVGNDPAKTVYASNAEDGSGNLATPWQLSNTSRGSASTLMQALQTSTTGYNSYQGTVNNPQLAIQNNSDNTSWSSYQPGGANSTGATAFKVFNGGISGATNVPLDVFRLDGSTNVTTQVARLSLSSNGSVMAIPEPSAMLLSIFGVGALAFRRRRA
jgi:hypothetical protein